MPRDLSPHATSRALQMMIAFLLTLPEFPTQSVLAARIGRTKHAISKALSGHNGLYLHEARVLSVIASRHGYQAFAEEFSAEDRRLLPAPEAAARPDRCHLNEVDGFIRGGGGFATLFLQRRWREARQYLDLVLTAVWSGYAELDQAEEDERTGRRPRRRTHGAPSTNGHAALPTLTTA